MQIPIHNQTGEQVGQIELPADIFQAPINMALMHQSLVRQLANARLGTHSTKDRGDVCRTKAKWYRQKGTGRARHGSRNAPTFVGGGIAHGPHPHGYAQKMPRKMRRAALRAALSAKALEGQIVLLDNLSMDQPKTRDFVGMLDALGIQESVLVLLADKNEPVTRSARNIPGVKILRTSYLNVRDLLNYHYLLIPQDSLDVIELILGMAGGRDASI